MKNKRIISLIAVPVLCAATVSFSGKTINQVEGNTSKEIVTETLEKSISCSFPVKNETVNILKPQVINYINAMREQAKSIQDDYVLHDFYVFSQQSDVNPENNTDKVRVSDFYSKSSNLGRAKKVNLVFDTENFEEGSEYTVTYGKTSDLSDGVQIKTYENFVSVTNLRARTKYYWQVSCGEVKSDIESFVTDDGFRYITANGIANVRDMGGRPVFGGKHIKQGLIFRGGEVVYVTSGQHTKNITEENAAIFTGEMDIKYEIDFRGDEESGNLTEAPLKTYYRNEKSKNIEMDYLRISNMGAYNNFFNNSPKNWEGIKEMFLAFKNANEKHVYFHCWGGADRTGTAGFLLGAILGMSYTDLIIDYELTSFANNYRPHNVNDPEYVYEFPAFIHALRTQKNSSGNLYWSETKTISSIVEEILIDKAGLTAQDIADIRTNLLED